MFELLRLQVARCDRLKGIETSLAKDIKGTPMLKDALEPHLKKMQAKIKSDCGDGGAKLISSK